MTLVFNKMLRESKFLSLTVDYRQMGTCVNDFDESYIQMCYAYLSNRCGHLVYKQIN